MKWPARAPMRAVMRTFVPERWTKVTGAPASDMVTVTTLQRRAADDQNAVRGREPSSDEGEPGPAIVVGERFAAAHPGDVFRRVQVVAVDIGRAETGGERGTDRRLAAAGDAHQDDSPSSGMRGHLRARP